VLPTSHRHAASSEGPSPLRLVSKSPFIAGAQVTEFRQRLSKLVAQEDGIAAGEITFGPFRLFPKEGLLLEADRPVRLGSRALDLLVALVERPGQLVTNKELMARIWSDVYVEPNNLTVHIAALRRALGDGRDGNRYLINIRGRGYRFVAPVAHADNRTCRHNLPAQVTRLVGRDETLRLLARRISEDRFLTIVGPGGIGKSSVALALAEEVAGNYEHGVWLVDLAHLNEASLVPTAIASVLGFGPLRGNPTASLVEALRNKQMLLVFDNCSHVVETAASVAVSILRGAAGVRILATGREPMRAEGERRYRLSSLPVPSGSTPHTAAEALRFSAVELFVQFAAAKLENFELTDADVPFIVNLCRKLDGIPLAIKFAAGRIDAFGVRGLAARLEAGVQSLTSSCRTALPRHQTLRSMLDWSYDWLPEPERTILCRLSILAGSFTLEKAIAVAANDDIEVSDIADSVASLVTKSLITVDLAGEEPLYRLFETTRAYVLDKLQECSDAYPIGRPSANDPSGSLDQTEAKWKLLPPASPLAS
jgi:predicted ATPase/DNA-binding winged helix-turn-helix (wHTH) protein